MVKHVILWKLKEEFSAESLCKFYFICRNKGA